MLVEYSEVTHKKAICGPNTQLHSMNTLSLWLCFCLMSCHRMSMLWPFVFSFLISTKVFLTIFRVGLNGHLIGILIDTTVDKFKRNFLNESLGSLKTHKHDGRQSQFCIVISNLYTQGIFYTYCYELFLLSIFKDSASHEMFAYLTILQNLF